MKTLLQTLILLLAVSAVASAQDITFANYNGEKANASDLATPDEKAGAELNQAGADSKIWDYGTIEQGSTGVRFFKFTNTGTAPLLIQNAKGSCGCTVPSYPREPIMPGENGYIKVKYDTKRVGNYAKYVTLTTNALSNTTTRLKIMGKVEAEPDPVPAKEKSLFN